MSSGEDRTHHWLLTSPGPGEVVILEDEPGMEATPSHHQDCDPSDGGLMSSPVTSLDLDRDSPLGGGLDEDEEAGPPSIETQPSDHPDHLEVSGITSTWINSGGNYSSSHPGLGFQMLHSDLPDTSDASGLNDMPNLDPSDFGVGPVYGPHMPGAPFSSPVQESESILYGDVMDENASVGICGLQNLGNTCFMAAGIQCLVNTPPIAQYFFKHRHDSEDTAVTLAGQFSQLTHKIWSGKYSALRPVEFKNTFGQQWRDFRDYRQHDCQEFVTLLLEALRKQMAVIEDDRREDVISAGSLDKTSDSRVDAAAIGSSGMASSSSSSNSSSSSSSCSRPSGSRETFSSPSSPQSPHCPTSPQSILSLKQPLEMQEEAMGLDSGCASPKSSVSSSSVDAHLINLRLQPIPEEVRIVNPLSDQMSLSVTASCQDSESVTSDISEPFEVGVRRYNQLNTGDACDSYDCDSSTTLTLITSHNLNSSAMHCDSSSSSGSSKKLKREVGSEKNLHSSFGISNECSSFLDKVTNKRNIVNAPGGPNSHLSLVKFEDIIKETKTSNVNVLVKDNPSNNEFVYDSEKYAKVEKCRLNISLDNLSKSGTKRVKEVNLLQDNKRECKFLEMEDEMETVGKENKALKKRMRIEGQIENRVEEKNVQYEMDRCQSSIDYQLDIRDASASTSEVNPLRIHPASSKSLREQKLSQESWKFFLGETKSAVVETFYGQFKSSLVCSVCGHMSVKYDPFGTFSVPLPFANQIQITVTYVPSDFSIPMRYLITLCKVSCVGDLKSSLSKIVGLESTENLVMAEVFDNHIARIVEDSYMTKFLNNLRSIYAFHLEPFPTVVEEECASTFKESHNLSESAEGVPGCSGSVPGSSNSAARGLGSSSSQWRPCTICLEEMCLTDLRTHHNCEDCLLCDGCIEMSGKHHGSSSLPCPVCQVTLAPSDLIPVEKRKEDKPKARLLRVPLVFRLDQESDNNNQRCMQLLGHPGLLSLPSRIHPASLVRIISQRIPINSIYTILLVDGRGYNCSRCLFSSHCRGCEIVQEVDRDITLQAGDTLCVRFTGLSPEQCHSLSRAEDNDSLSQLRQNNPLTLYDCLRAFTQSETLEDVDSWLCPKCNRKQQATKTISVWRFPPYLIIHLERFLFHGTLSTKLDDKVIFPLDGLDLSDYVAGGSGTEHIYNLYACVCHMGGAQAGHYTAFARSPVTGEWHYFNDDTVTRQKPRDEEYATAYLLFYHRQGTPFDLLLPNKFSFTEPSYGKCNNDQSEVVVESSSHDAEDGRRSRLSGEQRKSRMDDNDEQEAEQSGMTEDRDMEDSCIVEESGIIEENGMVDESGLGDERSLVQDSVMCDDSDLEEIMITRNNDVI